MDTYELKLPDDLESNKLRISLVKDPAVELTLMKFNKEEIKVHHFSDQEKRIIYAPAMVPNKLIYRENINGEPANVFYTEDTVEKFRDQYFRTQGNSKSNLYHMDNDVDGVDVVESWIVQDPENDKASSMGFKNIPKGTWMIGMKINSNEIWQEHIKTGKIDGLSIESVFLHNLVEGKSEDNELKQKENKTKMKKEISKLIFSAIKKVAMESELQKYSDGDLEFYAVDLEEGSIVTDAEGNALVNAELSQGDVKYKTDEIGAISIVAEAEAIVEEVELSEDEVKEDELEMADEAEVVAEEVSDEAVEIVESDEVKELKELVGSLEKQVEELNTKLADAEAEKIKSEANLVAMAKQTMSANKVKLTPKMTRQDFSKMSAREKFEYERSLNK